MYKILLISTILILALGTAPTNPICDIPTGGTLRSKTYTARTIPYDTTWTLLSSSSIPSMVQSEADTGRYYTTVVLQKDATIKIQTINEYLNVYTQQFTIATPYEIADVFGNVVAVNENMNPSPTSDKVMVFYFFNHVNPRSANLSRVQGRVNN